ncbi:MAG: HAMP domain-containing histidine kinase, partial [Oscillospiraceae bacterium]|nr:HAMP domain-containing histidine kinase [Oscillospiraceae bacterium]
YVDITVNPFEQVTVTQSLTLRSYKDIDSYMQQLFEGYSVYLKVNETLEQGDMLYRSSLLHSALRNSCKDYLIASVVFILLTLAVTVFLCIISGKRKDGSIKLTFFDKIPFIINLAITGFLGVGTLGIAYMLIEEYTRVLTPTYNDIYYYNGTIQPYFFYKLSAVFIVLCVLVLIVFILYIVRNVKAKTLKDRFILPKITKFLSAKIKRLNEASNVLKHKSKYIVFLIFLCALFLMLTTLLCMVFDGAVLILIVNIIATILVTLYALMYASNVITLSEAAKKLKNGDLDININPEKFVPQLRQFASDLIESKIAIEKAVEDAVKGERLKTELITNVSHDLKTPLTSIINYVSLLKMCEIENPDAKGYIDILDEKSNKLKRLIEDLVEASKATSGNIKMTFSTVKLNEMALQMVGENSDVLESAGLESILTQKDEDIFVKADSQHTYRIFENLFSNVKKYSQSGTRVYIDIYKENGYGVFSVKNVSRERLNISPDELTERFVRGDNSRTTSGSGLGLSIAKDFTELQNGIFEIVIDGDMFKVNVKLPLAK